MIQTFAALLFAHVLADFALQTRWIAANKRRPGVLLLHGVIVLALSQAAVGQVAAPAILALAAAHLVTDAAKTFLGTRGLAAFLADQAVHLAIVAATGVLAPGLWAGGLWAALPAPLPALLLHAMVLAGGLIAATRAGGFAVGLLMAPYSSADIDTPDDASRPGGLPRGGRTIGLLERGLIFALVLAGQPAAIGFLIAAKSILRFGAVAEDRSASEYVIIGTLASFGWALLTAYATTALLSALPPLEMLAPPA